MVIENESLRGMIMGNRFGAYASVAEAEASLVGDGFERGEVYWRGPLGLTSGTLAEAPRPVRALCLIHECKVAPQYGGVSYYEIEFC